MSRAFHTACNGRMGPVVVVLPEDVLRDLAGVPDVPMRRSLNIEASSKDLIAFSTLVGESKRPLLIAGGRNWDPEARAALHQFSRHWKLPVAAAWRYHDVFDHGDEHYVGDVGIGMNPELEGALQALGPGHRAGYSSRRNDNERLQPFAASAAGTKTDSYLSESRGIGPGVLPRARDRSYCTRICALGFPQLPIPETLPWAETTQNLRHSYLKWIKPATVQGELDLSMVMVELDQMLAKDAIVTNGAGNNTGWLHRFFRFVGERRQLAPTSGSMGYGLPAAIAASLAYPNRQVVAVVGDGDIQMTSQELATVAQQKLSVIIIVVNNAMLGTIRMHQEVHYPGRVSNTALQNPDFCALAAAHGLASARVTRTEAFSSALENALSESGSTLIEIVTGAEAISHTATITELRKRSH